MDYTARLVEQQCRVPSRKTHVQCRSSIQCKCQRHKNATFCKEGGHHLRRCLQLSPNSQIQRHRPKSRARKLQYPSDRGSPGVGSDLQGNTESGLNTKAALDFTSIGPACKFGFTPDDPCLPAWETGVGGGGPYAQRAVPNAIMFKSSVAAFNERDIFIWATPSAARGFWPLSAQSQNPPDPPNTWSYSMVKMHVHGKFGTLNLTSNPQDMPDINFRFYEGANGQPDL